MVSVAGPEGIAPASIRIRANQDPNDSYPADYGTLMMMMMMPLPSKRILRAMWLWIGFVSWISTASEAFMVRTTLPIPATRLCTSVRHTTVRLALAPLTTVAAVDMDGSTLILAAEQTWRQYTSLALIASVLLDIVLGSPVANTLLKPLRGEDDTVDNAAPGGGKNNTGQNRVPKFKERVDSESVARAALEKAQNTLALRQFLEDQKTDWDRMEEMKRKLDSEMRALDADLQARRQPSSLLSKRQPQDKDAPQP